jgi:hypothetical protein
MFGAFLMHDDMYATVTNVYRLLFVIKAICTRLDKKKHIMYMNDLVYSTRFVKNIGFIIHNCDKYMTLST